jgi:murein DD-endopeptidase MepM/ murein hydrolase activator NlpD
MRGTPCHAIADGTVTRIFLGDSNRISKRTGPSIFIEHPDGYASFSCHMSEIDVAVSDKVRQGQIIGLTGDPGIDGGFGTGAHLHWEIWHDGVRVRMEDLVTAGVIGAPGAGGPREETDVRVDGNLDDAMIERLWYGSARTEAARNSIPYRPEFGIPTLWREQLLAGRPLGAAMSDEEQDVSDPNRVVQYFTNGAITWKRDENRGFVN